MSRITIIILISLGVSLIAAIPFFISTYKKFMENPEELQKMTDKTFDNLSKDKLKEKWAAAEAEARAEIEAEEEAKRQRKEAKRREKIIKKNALK